jgi:hypothetical protein
MKNTTKTIAARGRPAMESGHYDLENSAKNAQ